MMPSVVASPFAGALAGASATGFASLRVAGWMLGAATGAPVRRALVVEGAGASPGACQVSSLHDWRAVQRKQHFNP